MNIYNQDQFDKLPSTMENETIIKIVGGLDKIDREIEGAKIEIYENAYVEEICGSAKINYVFGSAKINCIYGSAKIYHVYGSAEINGIYGSAEIYNVHGWGEIDSVYGSAEIKHVYGSAIINYYASISPLPKILQNAQILKIEKTYHNPSNNKYYWDEEMMIPCYYD